jgi:hypothetical protein
MAMLRAVRKMAPIINVPVRSTRVPIRSGPENPPIS